MGDEKKSTKREMLASGEVSAIYGTKVGKKEIRDMYLESDYLKKMQEFLSAHKEIDNRSGLMMTMESLAVGLALIDCVGEKGLIDNSKAKSVEDYIDLQSRLSDAEVSESEKRAIRDFLEVMKGKAIDILRGYCEKNKVDIDKKAKKNEETEKVREQLEELRVEIDKLQDFMNGSVSKFNETLDEINAKMENYSMEVNKLQEQMDVLLRASDGIEYSAEKTEEANDEYLQKLIQNKRFLSEREYNDRYLWVIQSEERVAMARQKIILIHEYGEEIQGYITRAEEALSKI